MQLTDLIYQNENIDIDGYIIFREYVKSHMEHPEWLGDFTKEDLVNMLETGSKIWMYYFNNQPVCSMMLIPADKKALSKFEININYQEVADYGPMMVSPQYVGNGFQYQMLKELDNYCIQNNYHYAAATIHPDNIYSINNIIKDEFELVNQKEFTRGLRNIYLKKL